MKLKGFTMPKGLVSTLSKASLGMQQKAPTLLVAGGIVGIIASTVLACRATLKAEAVVEAGNEKIEEIRETSPEETKQKDVTRAYMKLGLEVAVLYLPAVGLGALSIAGILTSHNILTKRNTALATAYAALQSSFNDYRLRVVDKYGEEAEQAILYDLKEETEEVVGEDGKKKKKKVVTAGKLASPYARYFMPYNPNDPHEGTTSYERNMDYNRTIISGVEHMVNDNLRAYGYVFLNDVYAALNLSKTKTGQFVGWILDKDKPNGDNYIKFYKKEVRVKDGYGDMVDAILLDFNVDGEIMSGARERALILE